MKVPNLQLSALKKFVPQTCKGMPVHLSQTKRSVLAILDDHGDRDSNHFANHSFGFKRKEFIWSSDGKESITMLQLTRMISTSLTPSLKRSFSKESKRSKELITPITPFFNQAKLLELAVNNMDGVAEGGVNFVVGLDGLQKEVE